MGQTCKIVESETGDRRRHPRRSVHDHAILRLDNHFAQADIQDVSRGGLRLINCGLFDKQTTYWAIRVDATVTISPRGVPVTVWCGILRQDPVTKSLAVRITRSTDDDAWQAYCAGLPKPKSAA